jgi:sirohydrochlorin cobaltochelatase
MPKNLDDERTLKAFEEKLRTVLPEEYQEHYEDVQPVSMGSAALKFAKDGKVAWDHIWETFCDLAMAGGPPHKGMLLEPGSPAEIAAQSDRYQQVIAEICRGVALVTGLTAQPSPIPGWVRVRCESSVMADWLLRAIVMENISARNEGFMLDLPAGPSYRVEKEIKNVITSIAKTCHYWLYHMGLTQQRRIEDLFATLALETPLIQPGMSDDESKRAGTEALRADIGEAIKQATGLEPAAHHYTTWLGLQCLNVRAAVWMMRAMVISNVLSRREGTVLFVPVNSNTDSSGERVIQSVIRTHGLARIRKVL